MVHVFRCLILVVNVVLFSGALHDVLHEKRYSPWSLLEWFGQVSCLAPLYLQIAFNDCGNKTKVRTVEIYSDTTN